VQEEDDGPSMEMAEETHGVLTTNGRGAGALTLGRFVRECL